MRIFSILLLFFFYHNYSQKINLNNHEIIKKLRIDELAGDLEHNSSLTILPLSLDNISDNNTSFEKNTYSPYVLKSKSNKFFLKLLPIDYSLEYNTKHPYPSNNGAMIPNVGYQHLISLGFYGKVGPLNFQFKPEHQFSENKKFNGFWLGHDGPTWVNRYKLWNHIDLPERFGNKRHNNFLLGQSSLGIDFLSFSFGFSNENLWWGPGIYNSILMSNNPRGFHHLYFKTISPIKTKIGNFEWYLLSAKLKSSGFTPPGTEKQYPENVFLYRKKINQIGRSDDWRYLQALIMTYSPSFINGLSIGFIRTSQMYSALVEGKYTWMNGSPTYFPVFANLFRKNDQFTDYEDQIDQSAGLFFRWVMKDSKAEIYGEYNFHDAKWNLRDLLVNPEHARAYTIGLQKVFKKSNYNLVFNWEWTQLEQSPSRIVRSAGSWYRHSFVYDGYTNFGEVLGFKVGPGSNSQNLSISYVKDFKTIGFNFEFFARDNDFFHMAFESSSDFRRYWKDYNFQINYNNKFNNFYISSKLIYQNSLNYQWELSENSSSYYQKGNDLANIFLSIKLSYFIPLD